MDCGGRRSSGELGDMLVVEAQRPRSNRDILRGKERKKGRATNLLSKVGPDRPDSLGAKNLLTLIGGGEVLGRRGLFNRFVYADALLPSAPPFTKPFEAPTHRLDAG